jgi:hypothetical protein
MEPKTNAKDFFLHLGAIVALYAVAISFVNMLFTVINKAFPMVNQYSYGYYYGGYNPFDISLPVATLIIVFPIFVLLSWLLGKSYAVDATKKEIWVRRWLVYITLFVAGIIFVGDLVTVLYKFLSGEDFTTAFLLKALTVLAVTGLVFGYYLQEIRDRVGGKGRKMWAILSTVIVVAAITLGFSVIGSPKTQRLLRYDNQKVNDLQNIQWQVISQWQRKGVLPSSLAELNDPISGYQLPVDPQSKDPYEYTRTGAKSFQLCATFNKEPLKIPAGGVGGIGVGRDMSIAMPAEPRGVKGPNYWDHGVGRQCFDREIDESLYPINKPLPVR